MTRGPCDHLSSDGRLIDISSRMSMGTATWPESPGFLTRRVLDIDRRDPCNVSILWLGSHCGTHVNAPAHVSVSGQPIDRMPLDATVGTARVVEHLRDDPIGDKDVAHWNVQPGERLLIRTRRRLAEPPRPAFLSSPAAQTLAALRPRAVGIDRPSIGDDQDPQMLAHRALLAHEVWIIEGLELAEVEPGTYELICLPLKLLDGDAAPARAVLRVVQSRPKGT